MQFNVKVEILNPWAENGYYGFFYQIFINGEFIKEGNYESDHVWSDKQMLWDLENTDMACRLALEQL